MQRRTSLLVHLRAGYLGSVQTATNLHLDALGTSAHSVLDGHLDGTAICNLALNLTSQVVAHDVCVQVRALHLEDVDLNVLVEDFLQLFLQLVNILSALADDDTGPGSADGDGDKSVCALDDDTRDTGLGQTLHEILAYLLVFHDVVAEVLASEPVRVPAFDYTQSVAYRVYFLSHTLSSFRRC